MSIIIKPSTKSDKNIQLSLIIKTLFILVRKMHQILLNIKILEEKNYMKTGIRKMRIGVIH